MMPKYIVVDDSVPPLEKIAGIGTDGQLWVNSEYLDKMKADARAEGWDAAVEACAKEAESHTASEWPDENLPAEIAQSIRALSTAKAEANKHRFANDIYFDVDGNAVAAKAE